MALMQRLSAPGTSPASQTEKPDPDRSLAQQLQGLRTQEQQLLGEYRWLDPEAGVARIPIERAIEIVAEKGISPPPQAPAPSTNEQP
jgi:hypothetical protein